ncbi:MAG: WecB/TagA/CpsF family glycosyltransferase [Candidatus Magasanikbacteria bacterium]
MTEILGVRIDNIDKDQALKQVNDFLDSTDQHKIFTPNPEMLVDADKNEKFRYILNSSSLNICDGMGIQLFSKEKVQRIPGVDFMLEICKTAEEREKSVYLLGGGKSDGTTGTEKELKKRFSKLDIVGSCQGPDISSSLEVDERENSSAITDISHASPDILFVAFGHRKQEWWINTFLKDLPSVTIAMGVGGAFDYIGGSVKRAPKWIQKVGFEWFFRLINQPKRIKRIFKAVFIFPYLVLKERYASKRSK